VVSASREAEVGGGPEPRSLRSAWAAQQSLILKEREREGERERQRERERERRRKREAEREREMFCYVFLVIKVSIQKILKSRNKEIKCPSHVTSLPGMEVVVTPQCVSFKYFSVPLFFT
jgi:hypothetical protein